jgi:malonyl-CoA O-methyltransferase
MQSAPIDLQRVRALFRQPARVADSDFLRREIAARMHDRLSLIKIAPHSVLDAGCGEGSDLSVLQKRFEDATIVGIDGAYAMGQQARSRHARELPALRKMLADWLPGTIAGGSATPVVVCGDFARLPLGMQTVDLLWSNLALHWHPQPDLVFAEWRRVLRVDGLVMFSCFGPDTFKELRNAFAQADRDAHALSFVDMHDFGDMLVNVGFSTPVMDMETITVTYESVAKLIADVRAWGGNPLLTRRRGLFGRRAWAAMVDALHALRGADGRIPLTFEIIYGHAFRPVSTKTASGEAIIRFESRKK